MGRKRVSGNQSAWDDMLLHEQFLTRLSLKSWRVVFLSGLLVTVEGIDRAHCHVWRVTCLLFAISHGGQCVFVLVMVVVEKGGSQTTTGGGGGDHNRS